MNIFIVATKRWWNANPLSLAAALSYYGLFSLIPLVSIIISVANIVLRNPGIPGVVITDIEAFSGIHGLASIGTFHTLGLADLSSFTTLVSVILIIYGALGVFSQLQNSFDVLWEVRNHQNFFTTIKKKFSAFTLILIFALIIIVSIIANSFLMLFASSLNVLLPTVVPIISWGTTIVSFVLIVIAIAIMFRYIPDLKLSWKAIFIGALLTTFLFALGRLLIDTYLNYLHLADSYGPASIFIAILIWVYYSALILFWGAAFTYEFGKSEAVVV